MLEPLGNKLKDFQSKVEEVYVQEGKDRSALGEQVKQLMSLSQTVSNDAKSLADALKGSSKTQGNWGELVLERVLEASGLRKGHEYELRETYQYGNGHRGQPDVVVNLPEDRNLVIDAKVSLKDYEEWVDAESDADRPAAADHHLASVRRHIKELSEKGFLGLHGLNSLDFVIMFVPVEPAFALAIAEDSGLWEEAWKKSVLLVSPSTLSFALRTVAYLRGDRRRTRLGTYRRLQVRARTSTTSLSDLSAIWRRLVNDYESGKKKPTIPPSTNSAKVAVTLYEELRSLRN